MRQPAVALTGFESIDARGYAGRGRTVSTRRSLVRSLLISWLSGVIVMVEHRCRQSEDPRSEIEVRQEVAADRVAPRHAALPKVLPFVVALAVALVSGTALARGGHGGGGGGHSGGGGSHGGGFSGGGHAYASGGHVGGRYGSHLFLGAGALWGGGAHWGTGFWLWGGSAWVPYPGRWWVSPAYPGWVWMVPQPVWDGTQWLSQDGYWTTADMPQALPPPQEPPVDGPVEEPPPEE
jgi:hypothetical protein